MTGSQESDNLDVFPYGLFSELREYQAYDVRTYFKYRTDFYRRGLRFAPTGNEYTRSPAEDTVGTRMYSWYGSYKRSMLK